MPITPMLANVRNARKGCSRRCRTPLTGFPEAEKCPGPGGAKDEDAVDPSFLVPLRTKNHLSPDPGPSETRAGLTPGEPVKPRPLTADVLLVLLLLSGSTAEHDRCQPALTFSTIDLVPISGFRP